mmetsp:Transcript_2663/g.7095  ORF Transcript_2663/g.7095 Transcript_2663/m.7095 type:complete len:329 (+) Transcript_2663:198-1184(+)
MREPRRGTHRGGNLFHGHPSLSATGRRRLQRQRRSGIQWAHSWPPRPAPGAPDLSVRRGHLRRFGGRHQAAQGGIRGPVADTEALLRDLRRVALATQGRLLTPARPEGRKRNRGRAGTESGDDAARRGRPADLLPEHHAHVRNETKNPRNEKTHHGDGPGCQRQRAVQRVPGRRDDRPGTLWPGSPPRPEGPGILHHCEGKGRDDHCRDIESTHRMLSRSGPQRRRPIVPNGRGGGGFPAVRCANQRQESCDPAGARGTLQALQSHGRATQESRKANVRFEEPGGTIQGAFVLVFEARISLKLLTHVGRDTDDSTCTNTTTTTTTFIH